MGCGAGIRHKLESELYGPVFEGPVQSARKGAGTIMEPDGDAHTVTDQRTDPLADLKARCGHQVDLKIAGMVPEEGTTNSRADHHMVRGRLG